ncbi:MAG TPA: hypothetical protein VFU99_07430 [Gaiellaceae bacterium]|nr:hypothetical protein [Gaiellaceae bacterium]
MSLFVLPLVLAVAAAGTALGGGNGSTMAHAQATGWDCRSQIGAIGGYYHCAPPGKPSVWNLIAGDTDAASVELRVFNLDGSFAGIESLIRADLYGGQPCPQDNLDEWALLELPGADYRACHRFDT